MLYGVRFIRTYIVYRKEYPRRTEFQRVIGWIHLSVSLWVDGHAWQLFFVHSRQCMTVYNIIVMW